MYDLYNRNGRSMYLATCLRIFCVFLCAFALVQPVLADEKGDIALLDRSAKAFASVVKKASPAVVHLAVEKSVEARRSGSNLPDLFNDPFFQRFFGPQFQQPQREQQARKFTRKAAGSGFIVSHDGYILTNNHVVEDAEKITVRLDDEREFSAKVIGTDPQSDVAVIKINGKNLPTLALGDSDALEVGEWVIAIGSPFELNQTVTVGVVSAKGRNRMGINDYENFIQTDAAINPGNSGGPLLNIYGKVVGINTAIFSRSGGYMGIGFAIPVNMAQSIQKQLVDKGKVTRGWLGVVIQDVTEELADSFGLDSAKGIIIADVTNDSPAQDAGLQQGDVLVKMDGVELEDVADLRNKIAMTPPNSKVRFAVMRDGKLTKLTVKIGEQPADLTAVVGKSEKAGATPLNRLGLTLQNLSPELAQQFGYHLKQGVLITNVEADSPAAQVGLQAGHLIEAINRVPVNTVENLQEILQKVREDAPVLLRVRSGHVSQYVVLHAK